MESSSSSATIAARLLILAALLGGCPRVEVGGLPEAESTEPAVRVGLVAGPGEVVVGGGGPVLLSGDGGGGLIAIAGGATATIGSDGGGVRARIGGATHTAAAFTARPADTGGFVRINGREYRGEVTFAAGPNGVQAVNLLGLEGYVAGVVNAEIGRRPPADSEAVFAQAVISRTVAVRALGRYRIRGYDLAATVADQAYGGVASETAMGWNAVRATRGLVVTWGEQVIEAFFHSTCGGRTESVENVFSGGAQPYLVSRSDRDPSGQAYCAASPRFRWREEWTGEALARTLRGNGSIAGLAAEAAAIPADLQIGSRSPSGRASELVLVAGGRALPIAGQQTIRQLLRLADGGWLRSTQFTLQATRSGGRIVRLVADGGGAGHGVGMCQWGAVGRARAGYAYPDILSAYFPGTEIRRFY